MTTIKFDFIPALSFSVLVLFKSCLEAFGKLGNGGNHVMGMRKQSHRQFCEETSPDRACMCCLDIRDLCLVLLFVTAITFMDFSWPARLSLYAKECSKFNLHAARVSFSAFLEKCYLY